ncbi:hypothetical protein KQ939_13515 [Planococcus sp. CP5-4]|uniref:hypothetical protein n=1 Tax=unclassified Planococcus (in: firmicutes) TaxID=2662419 RepID=UPI001C212CD8|nr:MULTISPECIES: hypothetical protein [unclassified Planococcus (in: firmicutes)]MBU9674457.1 hypothetical protein [Planococcus sp. CP5-4_YE]MBV0910088.1 hypothetical protein [Planococcus sp. CP5-4_UN]MBW6064704.1 hypothetical protein [Planococcus sp. CP5-4]
MKRTFLVAMILSVFTTWGHIFFDLRAVLPDPVAKLAVAIALFILFIGMIQWIVQKGEEDEPDS